MTFKRPHKRIAELEKEIALLRDLLRRREAELAAYDEAADHALVETHAETPADVAELVILLEHALERHRTIERQIAERDATIEQLHTIINNHVAERMRAKPAGYEHFTHEAIAAIRETTSTQAIRAGETQDQIFARTIAPTYDAIMAGDGERMALMAVEVDVEPPPAKDDAQ